MRSYLSVAAILFATTFATAADAQTRAKRGTAGTRRAPSSFTVTRSSSGLGAVRGRRKDGPDGDDLRLSAQTRGALRDSARGVSTALRPGGEGEWHMEDEKKIAATGNLHDSVHGRN